jgi:hypothetical protein
MLFDPERLKKGYATQEIADGVHYVTSGAYDAMFVKPMRVRAYTKPSHRTLTVMPRLYRRLARLQAA